MTKEFTENVTRALKDLLGQCRLDIEKFNQLDDETKMKFFYMALELSSKKMNDFVNQYRSYGHKRNEFNSLVLELLK